MSGVDVITFGCRLNSYESEIIRREAETAGLNNAIVVNTCAVTAEAVRQAKQSIRRKRRENRSPRPVERLPWELADDEDPRSWKDLPSSSDSETRIDAWRQGFINGPIDASAAAASSSSWRQTTLDEEL